MRNVLSILFIGLFLVSCSMQEEVVSPEFETTPAVKEVVIEFDSFTIDYNVCLFSRDSVAITIESPDSTGIYTILSQNGSVTSVNKIDTILCKRGDQILFDVNFDGKPEQTETVTFPWFTVDATFYPAQYGDSAYTHIEVYTFISHQVSPTYTSHYQWGSYYIIRNGVRYSLSTFGVTGNWCNGECNPYIKIWTKGGDKIVLDYNNDGVSEYEYNVIDPNHT